MRKKVKSKRSKGGKATLKKYGRKHFVKLAKKMHRLKKKKENDNRNKQSKI